MNLNGHIISEKNAEESAGHSCHLFEIIEYKGTNTSHLKKKVTKALYRVSTYLKSKYDSQEKFILFLKQLNQYHSYFKKQASF